MAESVDGKRLHPLLEGTVSGDPAGTLRMYEFDMRKKRYTNKRWAYKLDAANHAIGDAIAVDRHRFLIIERDGAQGDAAQVKRVYLADTRDRDRDGALDKTLVADLLDVANPQGLGGFGETFRFPFETIEDVALLDDRTLIIANDNNFPFSSGRTPGKADNNEFITVRLSHPLKADRRALPGVVLGLPSGPALIAGSRREPDESRLPGVTTGCLGPLPGVRRTTSGTKGRGGDG